MSLSLDDIAVVPRGVTVSDMDTAFAANEDYQSLSDEQRAALCRELQEAADVYQYHSAYEGAPAPSVVQRELGRLIKSLERVGMFGRALNEDPSPARRFAVVAMEDVATRWAKEQPQGALPDQFHISKFESDGYSETDYGARGAIESFFAFAPVIYAFASEALSDLNESEREGFQLSAIEWLVGSGLPLIYEHVTKKKFTSTMSADETEHSPGIRFVVDALAAIGVAPKSGGRFSPHTVRTHRHKALKARRD